HSRITSCSPLASALRITMQLGGTILLHVSSSRTHFTQTPSLLVRPKKYSVRLVAWTNKSKSLGGQTDVRRINQKHTRTCGNNRHAGSDLVYYRFGSCSVH